MITTKSHPWDQRGPNMMVGFDHEGNQVAIEFIDDDDSRNASRYLWLRANAKEIVFVGHDNEVHVFGAFDDKGEELDAAVDATISSNTLDE